MRTGYQKYKPPIVSQEFVNFTVKQKQNDYIYQLLLLVTSTIFFDTKGLFGVEADATVNVM